MFKKAAAFLAIYFVSSIVFSLNAHATELECNYYDKATASTYTITWSDNGVNSVSSNKNYVLDDSAISETDFKIDNNKYNCPSLLYIKNEYNLNLQVLKLQFVDEIGFEKKSLKSGLLEIESPIKTEEGEATDKGGKLTCKDFEIAENVNFINGMFGLLMIAGPILLIIFGSVDFGKATLSGDEQMLRKAIINFGKRAIATVILLILPLIINIIFKIAFNAGIFGEDLGEPPTTCINK